MELSVVIPVYNEAANVLVLYHRLQQAIQPLAISYELLFVNDGSADSSLDLIKQLAQQNTQVRYLDFSRNFGQQIAISAGLDKAKGNAVVILDGDLQDPPELIPALYAQWQKGHEVVYARRKTRAGESLTKKTTARLFYRLLTRITHTSMPVDAGDFRIISRKVVNTLKQMPEQQKFIRGQIAWLGFPQTFLEYDRLERYQGQSGYSYTKMIRLALDGITSYSNLPLKMATVSGFGVSGIAFLVMLYTLYSRFITRDYVPGWSSLMVSILFLGGVQLIAIGIIGEYMSRLSENVRNRPLYIVNETNIPEEVN
ncbi:glycosyltransferase family 2 protein [Adhaeribacter pallidiroseus]|uniref:Undecaprenyl-phosphate 4-deoxy-4-formamido-L-arabinose transferase n=1 Tax=Adhaeribacter pallidiroseus TaxID=2072847 RepID=A0A369QRX8_9BACT|nr:glycosyltransferase family 2 protein [Adhaeribacter pallidiroseus]RDC66415.1 Undecaprenyl-phosphate 4-deoxy-4-formamido-L-arabinose transferase [Adhaeribacter pallidiroseus]